MCNAIAQGYMQPWIPALPPPTAPATPSKDKSEKAEKAKGRQSGKGAKGGPSKGSLQTVVVDPEATPDLKQALEVRVPAMKQYLKTLQGLPQNIHACAISIQALV